MNVEELLEHKLRSMLYLNWNVMSKRRRKRGQFDLEIPTELF